MSKHTDVAESLDFSVWIRACDKLGGDEVDRICTEVDEEYKKARLADASQKHTANKGQTIVLNVVSSGPYLSSQYYKILEETSVSILWKRFNHVVKQNRPNKDNEVRYTKVYDNFDLGTHTIKKDSIIDMKNKYSPSSCEERYLIINNISINPNRHGTSSDIYYIKFNTNSEYSKNTDSWVDH